MPSKLSISATVHHFRYVVDLNPSVCIEAQLSFQTTTTSVLHVFSFPFFAKGLLINIAKIYTIEGELTYTDATLFREQFTERFEGVRLAGTVQTV